MIAVLIVNIVGLIVMLTITTILFVMYMKETKRYEEERAMWKKEKEYYIKQLKERNDKEI